MGNCTVKRAKKISKNYASSVKITVPNLSYLNRREKSLLVVESQESTEISLKKKAKVFRDSCIAAMPDSSIVVAGGSDSSGSLTSGVYQIFPFQKIIKQLPPLPIPSKYGQILQHQSSLIYIGGICEAQDFDSSQSEQGSPFCKFDPVLKSWKIFTEHNIQSSKKSLQRNIMCEDDFHQLSNKSSTISLKNIQEPGCLIQDDKLYLIGGKIFNGEEFQTSDKILSIKLNEDIFLNEENFSFPIRISSPSCCAINGLACVTGGFLWNMSENLEIFIVYLAKGSVRKMNLTVDRPLEPRYPIFMDDKGVLCFSPPKMMYLREDKQQIFCFGISTQVNHAEIEVKSEVTLPELVANENLINIHSEHSYQHPDHSDVQSLEFSEKQNLESIQSEQSIPNILDPDKQKSHASKLFHCLKCSQKLKRIKKSSPRNSEMCSHCKEYHSKKYSCPGCGFILCKSCSKFYVNLRSPARPYLSCLNMHLFCETGPEHPSSMCLSCNTLQASPLLFCFICDIYLCLGCFKPIEKFIDNLPECESKHKMKFVCKAEINCRKCEQREFGLFYCESCCFGLCFNCCRSKGEVEVEAFENFKPKEKLSYGFDIDEASLCAETEIQTKLLVHGKDSSPLSELPNQGFSEKLQTDENDVEVFGKSQSFATPLEDIKKVILQKPIRDNNKSPLILNLSPKKDYPDDPKLPKKGIATKFTMSPKNATITRNSLNFISEQQIQKFRSNYYIPKPLNNNFRPSNFEEPSYHRQIEEIKSYLNSSRELKEYEDMKSGLNTLRSDYELLFANESNIKSEENLAESQIVNEKINDSYNKNPFILNESSEEIQLIRLKKVKKSKEVEQDFSESEEIVIDNHLDPMLGSGNLDLSSEKEEKKGSESVSLFFPTMGDESEQVVAPKIEKNIAHDKLRALKAKLNLLTEKSFSSSESKSGSFQGFVFGKVQMSYSEDSISSIKSSSENHENQKKPKKPEKKHKRSSNEKTKKAKKSKKKHSSSSNLSENSKNIQDSDSSLNKSNTNSDSSSYNFQLPDMSCSEKSSIRSQKLKKKSKKSKKSESSISSPSSSS